MRLSNDPLPDRNVKSPNMVITHRLLNKALNHRLVRVVFHRNKGYKTNQSERKVTEILNKAIHGNGLQSRIKGPQIITCNLTDFCMQKGSLFREGIY